MNWLKTILILTLLFVSVGTFAQEYVHVTNFKEMPQQVVQTPNVSVNCGCQETKWSTVSVTITGGEKSGVNKVRASKGLPPLQGEPIVTKTSQSGTFQLSYKGVTYFANEMSVLYCHGYMVLNFVDIKTGGQVILTGIDFIVTTRDPVKVPAEKGG